jgi:hypothetical protein
MRSRTERIKSLLITKDRDFRVNATQLLNFIAFPAEKFTVESVGDAKVRLDFDKQIENVVVDGSLFPGKEGIVKFLKEWGDLVPSERGCTVLIMLNDEQATSLKQLSAALKGYHFRAMPLDKKAFVEVFHQARTDAGAPPAEAKPEPPAAAAKAPSSPAPAPAAASAVGAAQKAPSANAQTFFEASNHVRSTIDHINQVSADFKNVKTFIEIGNRFNGIFGTFAFLAGKEGYWQMHDLSIMIDTICRTYDLEPDRKEVEKSHFDFVLRAAKCSYLVLKELREEKPVSEPNTVETNAIKKEFEQFANLRRRESKSQEDVDSLLDDLLNKAS